MTARPPLVFNAGQIEQNQSGDTISVPTQTGGDNSTNAASTAFVQAALPVGANPTATAKDTAVNGTATTYMRSDGAPAVQKASSSQFGIVEVDNTTITANAGVITAVFPTATSSTHLQSTASVTPGTSYAVVTGCSVSLGAGTWLLVGQAALTFNSVTSTCYIKLVNTSDSVDITCGRFSQSSGGFLATIQIIGLIVLGSTKTIEMHARHDSTGNWTINDKSDSIQGTGLSALKIAN